MTDLRYDLIGADEAGEKRHPQEVMKSLGIFTTYTLHRKVWAISGGSGAAIYMLLQIQLDLNHYRHLLNL